MTQKRLAVPLYKDDIQIVNNSSFFHVFQTPFIGLTWVLCQKNAAKGYLYLCLRIWKSVWCLAPFFHLRQPVPQVLTLWIYLMVWGYSQACFQSPFGSPMIVIFAIGLVLFGGFSQTFIHLCMLSVLMGQTTGERNGGFEG